MADDKKPKRSRVEESFDRQGNGGNHPQEGERMADDDGGGSTPAAKGDLTWRAYLKLAATVLLTLILFGLLLRACAGVSESDPLSGEPTTQSPAPPPPEGEQPPPEGEQPPEGGQEGEQQEGQ